METDVESHRTIIEGGSLFDSPKGQIIEGISLLIKEKKIQWMGNQDELDSEAGDLIIDATDKFIFPGFINAHTHLSFNFGDKPDQYKMNNRSVQIAYDALVNAQTYLRYGFTTVRDCGGDGNWESSLRRSIASGKVVGPRLLASTKAMTQYGAFEYTGPDPYRLSDIKNQEVISGIDGVTHAVRERKALGADFIKILLTGAVSFGQGSDLDLSYWSDDELEAIIAEASRLGTYVSAHAHGDTGVQRGIDAGVRSIEHGMLMEESTAKKMAAKGTFLVLTETVLKAFSKKEELAKMPDWMRERTIYAKSKMTIAHKAAYEAGVKIAYGTDYLHTETAKEFEHMTKVVGMTTADAIKTATLNSAELLRLDDQIGSLEKGKLADLVILSQDPLGDVKILQDPANFHYVIKEGNIVSRAGIIQI
ncbi:MAG: amidohydrolase family protein [Candidatus Heimdallarchaeota archaeon]|nr:amidohydrolase family protein [Candidatus Heimdallarchaeota archaeon]